MHKLWVIIKSEYQQVVKKKSFIIGIFLTPALMAAFGLLPTYLATRTADSAETLAIIDQSGKGVGGKVSAALDEFKLSDGATPQYYVDTIITLGVDDSAAFQANLDTLKYLLTEQQIKYLLVVKPDFEKADTNMFLVSNSEGFRSISRFEHLISKIAATERLSKSNVNLSIDSVLALTAQVDLPRRDAKGESVDFGIKWGASMIFIMLIYFVIIGYGQIIMRSVIEEKSSRIMEVLVSSVTPFRLMLGKILGLGGATLTQLFIWLILGAVLYLGSGAMAMSMDPAIIHIVFNPVVISFFVLFLIFGYLMFSTLFALIGSIVNSDKEAQNFVLPVTMLLIVPFIIGISIIQDPNSTMARTLSFVPFFTPTLMMMRIIFIAPSATKLSFFSGILGEATLAFIILLLTTLAVVWAASRIFRVGILMYGKRPTLAEIVKWVRY